MFDLTGKKALITGATGGIGNAIAKALHARGATVTISGTRRAVLEEFSQTLAERVHIVEGNLFDPEAINRLISESEKVMGGLDILVNNAGITRDNLSMRMKDDEWAAVLEVNLTANFRLIRSALKGMMKQKRGRIINIGSIIGSTGNPGQANYAAAKAGLVGLTKSVAAEVASRNITVNCIAPGFIATAMTDVLSEKQKEAILSTIPSARLGSGDDIASAAVFLASDEASYVTGHTLHVNGGMAMF